MVFSFFSTGAGKKGSRAEGQKGSKRFAFLPSCPSALRPGTTLIEVLIFMAVLGAVGIAMFPLLFSATEDRLLQQTVATVEQSGVQLLQSIGYQVHHAERIIAPGMQDSGTILTLQTGSGAANPTIIGLSSGSLVLVQGTVRETLSSPQIAVESFTVKNTSPSSTRGSVLVTLHLSRTIRLQAPRTYEKSFEAAFAVFPADEPHGDDCNCAQPGCGSASQYVWQVCVSGTCQTAQTQLQCP